MLENAIVDAAPEKSIARLRVEKATTAFQYRQLPDRFQLIIETIEPVIADPSPLLGDYDSAKHYAEGVAVYRAALSKTATDPSLPEALLRRAMDEIESAMGLSDRERFVINARLRQTGSLLANEQSDLNKATEWLAPVFENRKWMSEDDYGAELLTRITNLHASYNSKLGRVDESLAAVREQVKELKANSELRDARRMELIDSLLLSYLVTFRDYPASPGAATAWQDVQDHIAEMESYRGDDAMAIQNSILAVRRTMLKYFPSRDVTESIKIVEQMLDQLITYPDLASDFSGALATFSISCELLKKLIDADDPRVQELRKRLTAFLDDAKTAGIDARTIEHMRVILRSVDKHRS